MSSTNRSNERVKHRMDYYVTPIEEIKKFLNNFQKKYNFSWEGSVVLDCCAGGNPQTEFDAYHPMSYPTAISELFPGTIIKTIDIREDSFAEEKADYLTKNIDYHPSVIITNPPFDKALPIIEKALKDVAHNGYVIMLLRLNFFGSKERELFFNEHMPESCFVHRKRMSFTDKKDPTTNRVVFDSKTGLPKKGGTDSIEYCHMVFRKDKHFDFTQLYII